MAIPVARYLRHPTAAMVPVIIAAMGIFSALQDLTASNRAGMWAVGLIMTIGAVLIVCLRAAPMPDWTAADAGYPRSQPTG